ncbi:Zn-ribbon domain-containing OB-fold protein [Halopiger thermotolerans]
MRDVFECSTCGKRTFYRKDRCPECGDDRFGRSAPGVGEVVSLTRVHVTPPGVREPNVLGLVEFDGGANVIVQLEGDLEVGDEVRLTDDRVLRADGDDTITGSRAVPADE